MRCARWASALVFGLFAGITTGLVLAKPATPPPSTGAGRECAQDSECALVPDGCCTCNEGGKQRAIATRKKDASERKRKQQCEHKVCPFVMSSDPSCTAKAVCKDGQCALGS